ncbi:hypothetical protein Asppvi_011041 [Aspergillus pseudoviridinutans]|uniref:C2H2-type domain-containing protein n=1 Tax=Aspergillus pseudoviridinutans TaxID=1517512 RepID=A0A9P3EXK8_9EURO|nr:uncharacterized protein Asppvi_011041 [Aspergillus pseudoviridinutans]GIJ92066.1 hypothetical protein Asppvi_011041 [Aspergillus pseudoviridinutans]
MANDYFEWLQNYRETGPSQFPQQNQYAASPTPFQGYPDSFLDFPPASQTPLSDIRQPYHYQTHYAPLEQYVRPQDPAYSSSSAYPFTSYQGGQQYRANPLATTQQPPPAPTPPSTLSQTLPADSAQTQPQNTLSYLNYPPFARATEVVDADISGHDAKRRRLESPATVTMSKPTMPPQESLSKFSFTPQDTTDRSFLRTRTDIAKPLNVTEAAEKLQYDPKTIARDVLIASGRHPTEAPLNHHLFRLRDVFVGLDTASDLETFRWDLVDPEEKQANNTSTARDIHPLSAPAHLTSAMARPAQPNPPYAGVAATPQHHRQQHQQLGQLQPRPLHTLQVSQTGPQQKSPSQPDSQRQVQLPSDPQSRSHPPPQVQLQVQPPSQPQLKPGPSIQIRTKSQPSPKAKSSPRQSTNMVGKRPPGRPPASSKIEVTIPVTSQIPYQVYTCGWENCQAELHNLEMLKKHIFKVHVPYTLTCQWKDCTFRENLPAVQLYKHVLSEHVVSIAWTLGDGPSVPATEGRVVDESPVPKTIPDSIQPGGEDSLVFPASYSSIRAFNRVHGNHTQIEKAREIFKAVQRLKEHIGYGLDPGGCQLATPARIGRVSNDEDVYAVRHES